jgi:hypothetical protein
MNFDMLHTAPKAIHLAAGCASLSVAGHAAPKFTRPEARARRPGAGAPLAAFGEKEMVEPSPLLRRITELEQRLSKAKDRIWATEVDVDHLWTDAAAVDAMVEHVLMPAILLLAGYGHRDAIVRMLQTAATDLSDRRPREEQLHEGAIENVESWLRTAAAAPTWTTPSHEHRRPELYPEI